MGILDVPGPSRRSVGLATRRAAYALSNAASGNAAGTHTDVVERWQMRLPVNTTRWRIHIRNWRADNYTANAGALAFNGVWIGRHSFNGNGQFTGNYTAAPTQALGAFNTAADGSEYVSAWVTDPTIQFAANVEHLVSAGFTCAGTTALASSTGPFAWGKSGAGASANAGAQTVSGLGGPFSSGALLDAWIEYEFTGTQPVGLVVADSIGYGYTTSVITPPTLSWPHQYQQMSGVPMVNTSISGASIASFYNAGAPTQALTKWPLTTFAPDFAIVVLGINDAIGLQASNMAGLKSIWDYLKNTVGIPRIFAGTLPPAGGYVPSGGQPWRQGTLQSSVAAGATSITTDVAFTSGQFIFLDPYNASIEQVTASAASTGTGPYTTTISATTKAHSAGAYAVNKGEQTRWSVNNSLRLLPNGLTGVIDLDRILRSPTLFPPVLDPDYDTGDHLHLLPWGYRRIAESIPSEVARPVL